MESSDFQDETPRDQNICSFEDFAQCDSEQEITIKKQLIPSLVLGKQVDSIEDIQKDKESNVSNSFENNN